jgi:hypothetical protein
MRYIVTSLSQILYTETAELRFDVIRVSQEEEKWATVRIPGELLEAVEKCVNEEKDEFGLPKYRSKSEAVAEAVKQFLKKHKREASNAEK